VVIGGPVVSKSFLGYTPTRSDLSSKEGLIVAVFLTLLPLFFLWVLVKLLPRGLRTAPTQPAGD